MHPSSSSGYGRSWHHLPDEPVRQCLGQMRRWSFFSSLVTARTAAKVYRTKDDAKADVFDYIECFCNPRRRHSTLGYLSHVEYEEQDKRA